LIGKLVRVHFSTELERSDHVEFVATYRLNGKAHKLRENSRFTHEAGKWFYLAAVEDDPK
jgi:SEC-C motif-containing protein